MPDRHPVADSRPVAATPTPGSGIDRRTLLGGALATAVLGAVGGRHLLGEADAAPGKVSTPGSTPGTVPAAKAEPKRAARMPALYLPHGGGPCFFMDWTMGPRDTWDRMAAFLRGIPATLPAKPRAMLVISAHWEESVPTLLTGARPSLYFDYSGFPDHTYQLTWPAPGAPGLAPDVQALLAKAGIPVATDAARGYDHGVFVPLKVAFPGAEIPVLQLSLRRGLDPAFHLALGRALAPLRDQGVFIVGSGMSYHNMRGFFSGGALAASQQFDTWLAETVALPAAARDARLRQWAQAPAARACHPREDHLLPLMVCAGAAMDDGGAAVYRDQVMGVAVSAHRFG